MRRNPAVGRLRGKTRAGRLRLWDALLEPLFSADCSHGVLDVGVGERPDTLVELATVLDHPPTAIEVHPRRVAAARAATVFPILEGDALQPPRGAERFGLVRCANVLRQYPVEAVEQAHRGLIAHCRPGGVVLEGSCDASGDVGCFHVLRSAPDGFTRSGLVFFSSFARGFAPIQLRDWLPRDLRRQVRDGGVMADFFRRWTTVWSAVRQRNAPIDFRRSVDALAEPGRVVDLSSTQSGAAAFFWTPEGGVPQPS